MRRKTIAIIISLVPSTVFAGTLFVDKGNGVYEKQVIVSAQDISERKTIAEKDLSLIKDKQIEIQNKINDLNVQLGYYVSALSTATATEVELQAEIDSIKSILKVVP